MSRTRPHRIAAAILAAGSLVFPLQSLAQTARTASEEYDDAIKGAQTIATLGPDLFGEAVNLKDGKTSFGAIDVSIPTNSGLPLSIGRTLGINSRDADKYVDPVADGELFGNWKLDVPVISGTFDERTGWVSASAANPQSRCSIVGAPPSVKSAYTQWDIYYYSEDYWRGYNIDIPGKGAQPMLGLLSGKPLPGDGKTYRWTTKNNWMISCIPLRNGAGEGFLVTLPDGTRYHFDWMSSRRAAALKDTHCENVYLGYEVRGVNVGHIMPDDLSSLHRLDSGGSVSGGGPATICNTNVVVNRREYFLHATRIEDRHGNTIVYDYDPANPRRLRSVASNDGGVISLSYGANGKISAISANGRQWQYQYADVATYGTKLIAVVLPDGSRWSFDYGELFSILDYDKKLKWPDCEPIVFGTTLANLRITHPSGAVGTFAFRNMVHGVDRTPGGCSIPNPETPLKTELSHHQMAYKVASLQSKQISGPGLTTQTWNYAYQPSWSWNLSGYVDNCSATEPCDSTTTTEVTGPDGTITRSVFGNDYYRSVGQLQRVEILSNGSLVQQTTFSHVPSSPGQAFAGRAGWDPLLMNNPFESEQVHPLYATTLTRDGDTYHWTVDTCGSATTYCFDAFARPTVVRKQNSMGTYKREVTEYHDNHDLWVLGQIARVYVTETSINNAASESQSIVVSQTDYNAQALPWRQYAFGKLQSTIAYNADGTTATIADGLGNTVSLSSWKRGMPRLIRHPETPEAPAGATESAEIDDNGWIVSTVDEIGARTCYQYDAMGRMNNVIYPSETGANGVCDTSSWHNRHLEFRQLAETEWMPPGIALSRWRHSIVQGNYAKVTYLDALWRPVLVHEYDTTNVSATLRSTRTEYGADGRVSFQSYPTSDLVPGAVGIRTAYDALGRTKRVEQDSELGVLTTTSEYLNGLRVRVTNPRGHQTTTQFMAWDQPDYDLPISSLQPEGKVQTIERHPRFGWPLRLTQRSADHSAEHSRRYVYDGHAQLCKTIEPETGVTVTGTDAAGNPTWSVSGLDRNAYGSLTDCQHVAAANTGLAVVREYDKRNRLTQLKFPGGRGDQIWTYTADSLPASITTYNDPGNQTAVVNAYTYNRRRLLTGESTTQPNWYTWSIGYAYDRTGNLAVQTYPNGREVYYDPDALGQATGVRDQSGQVYASGASYYPNGAIKQFTYGNGIVHSMQQNARQLPFKSISGNGVLHLQYGYDANANVDHIYDLTNGPEHSPRSRWMTYDGLDRLTSVGAGMFGGDHWHRFTYDALDNLKSWKLAGVKDYAEYVYDQQNRLTNIRNSAGATVVGLAYDAQGNLQNKNGQTYEFDYGNRLRAVTGKEAYRYDGLGRRVLNWRPPGAVGPNASLSLSLYSKAGQLIYVWDDQYPKHIEHFHLAGSVIAIRETAHPNGEVTLKYQHTDALGSPVAVTNAAGQVVERNDYEPWGAIIGQPNKNAVGYTGHMMDGATGLTYMQQRYYDPTIGRFLSVDPVTPDTRTGAHFNRYWYADANPYKYRDPDGRVVETVWDAANLAMGGASLARNLATGNYLGAALDVGGLFIDGLATVAPGVPGGAGAAIKAYRGTDRAVDSARGAGKASGGGKPRMQVRDVTKPRSVANYSINWTRSQFERHLTANGLTSVVSKDGRAVLYFKDGKHVYSIRDTSKSTNGPTADMYGPDGSLIAKIRFQQR